VKQTADPRSGDSVDGAAPIEVARIYSISEGGRVFSAFFTLGNGGGPLEGALVYYDRQADAYSFHSRTGEEFLGSFGLALCVGDAKLTILDERLYAELLKRARPYAIVEVL